MAITFVPRRGAVLMCDFDMARVRPEMDKLRPVVVVSKREFNHRHADLAGLCTVVPFSATRPDRVGPEDVFVPAGRYWSLPRNPWAKCKMVFTVSHDRLDLVLRHGKRRASESLEDADIRRIEAGIRIVLGLP